MGACAPPGLRAIPAAGVSVSFKAEADKTWSVVGANESKFINDVIRSGDGSFDVVSGGVAFWADYDEATFVNQKVTGDFDVRVKVVSVTSPGAKVDSVAMTAGGDARRSITVSLSSGVVFDASAGSIFVDEATSARDSSGGRVRTLRGYFDDGIYAELGAARVAESHEYVLTWLNDLGLSLIPFAPSGASVQVLGAQRARSDDEAARERLAPGLHRDERGLTSGELLRKYTEGVPEDLGHADVDLSQPRWREYDALTWPAWLAARGASKGAAQLMMLGGDSSTFSALFLLQQIMLHRDLRQYLKIAGGMDLLPRGIAARLTDAIRYNCELVRLERTGSGLRATYKQDGRMDVIPADRVVLAIPFSMLRRVALDPPFSPAKMSILAELSYYEGTRFLLQTKTRFWQTAKLTGGARTDGPADIWDMSYGQRGGRGLISLTTGNAAIEQKLAAMNPAARCGSRRSTSSTRVPEPARRSA
jgi:monoamine oxidase